jgi:DNA polymerase III subunit epsilon
MAMKRKKVMFINPGIPIPEASTRVHGITDDTVKDAPTFKEVAKTLARFSKGANLAGFNSNRFDIPFWPKSSFALRWILTLRNASLSMCRPYSTKWKNVPWQPHTNSIAANHWLMRTAPSPITRATYEVLKAQLDQYEDTEYEDNNGVVSKPIVNEVERLSQFSSYDNYVDYMGRIVYDEKGVEIFNFGKNKGVTVEKVLREQPGYYGWILQGDFPLYTKRVLTQIYIRLKEEGRL